MHKPIIALLVVGTSSTAFADDTPLGEQGQVVLRQQTTASITRTTVSSDLSDASWSSDMYAVGGTLEWFPVSRFSVGASFGARLEAFESPDASVTTLSIAPRVGYVVPLSGRVYLWPSVVLSYERSEWDDVEGGGEPWKRLAIGVEAPFVFTPAEHFFVGIGPMVERQLGTWYGDRRAERDTTTTTYGVTTTLGGYF